MTLQVVGSVRGLRKFAWFATPLFSQVVFLASFGIVRVAAERVVGGLCLFDLVHFRLFEPLWNMFVRKQSSGLLF